MDDMASTVGTSKLTHVDAAKKKILKKTSHWEFTSPRSVQKHSTNNAKESVLATHVVLGLEM